MDITYSLRLIGHHKYEVDTVHKCGKRFMGIATVFEMDNENPVLQLKHPYGVNGVKEILDLIKEHKATGR